MAPAHGPDEHRPPAPRLHPAGSFARSLLLRHRGAGFEIALAPFLHAGEVRPEPIMVRLGTARAESLELIPDRAARPAAAVVAGRQAHQSAPHELACVERLAGFRRSGGADRATPPLSRAGTPAGMAGYRAQRPALVGSIPGKTGWRVHARCQPGAHAGACGRDDGPRPAAELPDPPAAAVRMDFSLADLGELRRTVSRGAAEAPLEAERAEDLVLAVNELATNSICHGGGRGTLRMWQEPRDLVCEVADSGYLVEPLVARRAPGTEQRSGRGLWLVKQLCDEVEICSRPAGTRLRVRMRVGR